MCRGNGGGGGGGIGQAHTWTQQSDDVMLSKKNCLIPCTTALIEYFLRVVCGANAKHALWFAAAIGNMQFSQHGRWAYPYPGISLTFS